jgi:hypothetical protein
VINPFTCPTKNGKIRYLRLELMRSWSHENFSKPLKEFSIDITFCIDQHP